MKSSPLSTSLKALLVVTWTGCGLTSQPSGPPATPVVFCASEDRNLGEIPVDPHEPYAVEFVIENRGDAVLEVQGISASCACVRPHVSRRDIVPGDHATLRVGIQRPSSEERRATITVRTNDPLRPVLRLSLSWSATAPVAFEPASLEFGNLIAGEAVEANVRITRHATSRGTLPTVGDRRHSLKGLVTHWADDTQNDEEPWTARNMLVRVTALETMRETHGSIEIDVPDSPAGKVALPVRWRVRRLVEVSPAAVFLGSGSPGDRRRQTVVVDVPASHRLVVRNVELQPPSDELTVVQESTAERTVLLRIDMRLPERSGEHRSELRIACTEPTEMTLTVPVTLHVEATK